MQPFTVNKGITNTCLKRKFYNPELCNKYKYVNGNSGTTTTDDGTPSGSPIDYKWCKCDTATYINYPQPLKTDSRVYTEDRYYDYPYDLENFPT